jgi:predicted nucleic acid-binding protein
METILVDTSVWVNYLKNIDNQASLFINNNNTALLATCPTILQEILQGVKTEHEAILLQGYFDDMVHLIEEPYESAIEAAQLYRTLRKKGITIRKPNDCLIAIYAIKNNARLLHNDIDFTYIAQNSKLQVVEL